MVKNHALALSISDSGWGMLRHYLEYKAAEAGRQVEAVPPHYTSQRCSRCGEYVQKALSVRTHLCPHCGFVADRDVNAAMLVPAEIAITGCFLLLQHHGAITIPITGYPGAAPTFRLMMHPDGGHFGLDHLEKAIDDTFERTAGLLQQPAAVQTLLLGED